eukprot:833809-Ditylum_brightwellii.AAC.1
MKSASSQKYVSLTILDDRQHTTLLTKPMQGKFFVQQKDMLQVDLDQSHWWLRHANMRCKTKVAICAPQDQLMAMNYICNTIHKQAVNPLCRLC